LLPKRLTEYAGIEKDVVLSSSLNKIEIWSDKNFKTEMDNFNQQAFEALAEKVMSKKDEN
jgi:MraZ protein